TSVLLTGCPGTVYAVDTFEGSPEELETTHAEVKEGHLFNDFLANVGGFQNLQVMKMDSVEASQKFPDKYLDMVFIDGDHTYEGVYKDIASWLPKCRGLLCGHDSNLEPVKKALEDLDIHWKQGPGKIWFFEADKLS